MKTPLLIAVCLLIVGMLPGQKITQPKTIYYGQVLTEGELNIVVGAKGIVVNNTSDNATYVVNLTYEKCYAINPATAVYACDYGKILFKDTTSKKVVLRLELPNGEVKKFILSPKESPPQVMLDGGQLRGYHPASFFLLFFIDIQLYYSFNKKQNQIMRYTTFALCLFLFGNSWAQKNKQTIHENGLMIVDQNIGL